MDEVDCTVEHHVGAQYDEAEKCLPVVVKIVATECATAPIERVKAS